jgi:hypothetical protein
MRCYLQGPEALAMLGADLLDDDILLAELVDQHALAHAGYSDADGLRQLAALSFTLARRLERRASASAT